MLCFVSFNNPPISIPKKKKIEAENKPSAFTEIRLSLIRPAEKQPADVRHKLIDI